MLTSELGENKRKTTIAACCERPSSSFKNAEILRNISDLRKNVKNAEKKSEFFYFSKSQTQQNWDCPQSCVRGKEEVCYSL